MPCPPAIPANQATAATGTRSTNPRQPDHKITLSLALRRQGIKALAQTARGAGSDAIFRADLTHARRTNAQVRNRLAKLDEIVGTIAAKPDFNALGVSPSELTWRFLANLSILEPRPEGVDPSDRTAAVERLMPVTPDGTAASADNLYSRLAEKAGDYASNGARVDYDSLCADLRGLAFFRQPDDEDLPTLAAGDLSPGVRADALTLGPIDAILCRKEL